jgi:hypothetical protein
VYEQGNGYSTSPRRVFASAGKMNTVGSILGAGHTVLSGFLATGVGVINDREGVEAGDNYTRTYTFKRTSDWRAKV